MRKPNHTPMPQENLLANALRKRNIELIQQYDDGHKTVDIYIPKAKLDIEVDGTQHFMEPHQMMRDFKREYWSERAGYHTIHIPNHFIDRQDYLIRIVDALIDVVKLREVELLKLKLQKLMK